MTDTHAPVMARRIAKAPCVSGRGLNTSPEGFVLTPRLYQTRHLRMQLRRLFSRAASGLDAFSLYPRTRSCTALPCRTTVKLAASDPRSSRTKGSFPSGVKTPPRKSNTPVSRRCKPSSRSLLMGEQPHPWQLLHRQDRKSRHRSSKPPGRYELLLATTQLSPG